MFQVQDGQCGLCSHFGEVKPSNQQTLVQIRTSKQAPEDFVGGCGHPKHVGLHLVVTPISGCGGFAPVSMN